MTYSNRDLKISCKLTREREVSQASVDALATHVELIKIKWKESPNRFKQLRLDIKRDYLKRTLHQLVINFPELLKIWGFMREYETC
jgi:hypothetical protein